MLDCLRFSRVLRTLSGESVLRHAEWSRCRASDGLLLGDSNPNGGDVYPARCQCLIPRVAGTLPGGVDLSSSRGRYPSVLGGRFSLVAMLTRSLCLEPVVDELHVCVHAQLVYESTVPAWCNLIAGVTHIEQLLRRYVRLLPSTTTITPRFLLPLQGHPLRLELLEELVDRNYFELLEADHIFAVTAKKYWLRQGTLHTSLYSILPYTLPVPFAGSAGTTRLLAWG